MANNVAAQRGSYFLANDAVFDLVVAFLNSYRYHNPNSALCMIPYDAKCEKVLTLADKYNFQLYAPKDLLERCDHLSVQFQGKCRGEYRKLAMWDGPFESFTYIDVDTIVMSPFDGLYELLGTYDYVAGHSNIAGSRKFVWKDTICKDDILTSNEIEYAAGTGFLLSKKGVLNLNSLQERIACALPLRRHMAPEGVEQPLLNYLVMKSTKKFTSLYLLGKADPSPAFPQECWAGDPNWSVQVDRPSYYGDELKHVLFVHWAGEWTLSGFEYRINRLLRQLHLGRFAKTVRSNMRQKKLWTHFRFYAPDSQLPSPPQHQNKIGAVQLRS